MVKKSILMVGPTLALAALVGCTSLLGSFEVAPEGPAGPSAEAGPCTQCGADCVDLTSSAAHCGSCENACTGGQSCQASACACPAGKALCGGACVVATRKQCGQTCTECKDDEICGTACTAAPLAEFLTKPRDTTGWLDENNKPIAFTLKPVPAPGAIYECRTGRAASFTAATPEWKNCDGAAGTGTTYLPTPTAATPEGTYRTEFRYRSDTYRSEATSYVYYAHHSLDKVGICTATNGGPHFSDADYFAAASAFAQTSSEFLLAVNTFPALAATPARTDAIYLGNPWVHIPFRAIRLSNGAFRSAQWPANGADYDLNERSLRHEFVMNSTRSMVLMKRRYQSKKQDCKNKIHVGSKTEQSYGPVGFGRGPRTLDCEALVLNSHGNGLCMGSDGKKPVVLEVDKTPQYKSGVNAGTVSATVGSNIVADTGDNISNLKGWLIEIPASPGGGGAQGAWYTITDVTGQKMTLSQAYGSIPPATGSTSSPSGAALKFRLNAPPPLQSKFVLPSGMAKLHEDSHLAAAGLRPGSLGIIAPSFRTKCETEGCNALKPWLTYLPP